MWNDILKKATSEISEVAFTYLIVYQTLISIKVLQCQYAI